MPPDLERIVPYFQSLLGNPPNYLLELDYTKGRMASRNVDVEHIEAAIGNDAPQVIRDYSPYWSGVRCLILGWANNRPLHVLLRYEEPTPEVITVYWPDESPELWECNWTREVNQDDGNSVPLSQGDGST